MRAQTRVYLWIKAENCGLWVSSPYSDRCTSMRLAKEIGEGSRGENFAVQVFSPGGVESWYYEGAQVAGRPFGDHEILE